MGCGVSKFNKDEMGPAYLYCNPLHRRIDELAPWRRRDDRASSADPAAMKQLLAEEADSLSGGRSNDHGRKSVSCKFSSGEKALEDHSHVDECAVKLPPVPQQMKKAGGGSGDAGGEVTVANNADGGTSGGGKEVAAAAKEEEEEEARDDKKEGSCERREPTTDNKNEKTNDEDDEDCNLRLSDREDSIFYPGSPSFREYCFSSTNASADADSSDHVAVLNDHFTDDDHGESDIDQQRDSVTIESEKEEKPPPVDSAKIKPDEPAARADQPGKKSSRIRGGRRFRVGMMPRNRTWHLSSCSPHRTAGKAS